MAETNEGPLIPEHTRRATLILANLFIYSVAMFTLPFVAFFGVKHILTEYYPVSSFAITAWSVIAAVVVVNTIICVYAYKAYHEKEYDEQGNEIDQHSYEPLPLKETTEKSGLNLKQD
ncbi:unnamed protein product [Diatraea saccharalis]|uniref:Vacuolar ATPase assembly integral membrane protein VMA21 homolog n=1 Tax=Diatraea saccharalis TaxID=40085 RepID=A0A9N9W8Y2_9NEOP|nr:unnamed protein product [Diatraea saccharalis]